MKAVWTRIGCGIVVLGLQAFGVKAWGSSPPPPTLNVLVGSVGPAPCSTYCATCQSIAQIFVTNSYTNPAINPATAIATTVAGSPDIQVDAVVIPMSVNISPGNGVAAVDSCGAPGDEIYRYGVTTPNATDQRLLLTSVTLSAGATIYIQSALYPTVYIGPYTAAEVNNGVLALAKVPGDEAIIEWRVPAGESGNAGVITVDAAGILDPWGTTAQTGHALKVPTAWCQIDATCCANASAPTWGSYPNVTNETSSWSTSISPAQRQVQAGAPKSKFLSVALISSHLRD